MGVGLGNVAPFFLDYEAGKVRVVVQGRERELLLPRYFDPDGEDEDVSVTVHLSV